MSAKKKRPTVGRSTLACRVFQQDTGPSTPAANFGGLGDVFAIREL